MRKSTIIITIINRLIAGRLPTALLFMLFAAPLWCCAEESGFADTLHATFHISDGKTSGTCFVVQTEAGKHVLVTCAHTMEGFTGETCKVIFRSRNESGVYQRKEAEVAIRQGDDKLWRRHAKHDIAALPIEPPEGVLITPVAWADLADAKHFEQQLAVGDGVFIPGYPVDMEGNKVGWPIVRKGSIATFPLTPIEQVEKFYLNAATFGGDSGAPVIHVQRIDGRKHATVVGIVWGMRRQTSRSVSPFEERTLHTPLALAEAAPAPFIRETILLLEGQE